MDGAKDIQKTDNLTEFLDTQAVRTNPFGRNVSGLRAYRRAERVVAALYLLTNHVPPEEPVRIELRQAGIGLLSNVLDLRDEMRVSVSPTFHAMQVSVRKLISLVRLLSTAGYVSTQNSGIVIEALDELGNFLTVSQRSTLSESTTFSKDELLGGDGSTIPPTSIRRPISETGVFDAHERKNPLLIVKDKKYLKDISRTEEQHQEIGHTLDRRALAILEILKSQGAIGIKDIAANLPEYSEKMIQRELVRLVAFNRVKKIGFKRWSKYGLI